jgi:hypothetical protein
MRDVEQKVPSEWRSTRFWLTINVTIILVIAVTVLAGLIIQNSKDKAGEAAQNVLNSMLPTLVPWLGPFLLKTSVVKEMAAEQPWESRCDLSASAAILA